MLGQFLLLKKLTGKGKTYLTHDINIPINKKKS